MSSLYKDGFPAEQRAEDFPSPSFCSGCWRGCLPPAVSEADGETVQGRRRRLCSSSCALYSTTAKESSQPALSSRTHSFINERDDSARSRHWTQRWERTRSCSHPCLPPLAQPADTALQPRQLVQNGCCVQLIWAHTDAALCRLCTLTEYTERYKVYRASALLLVLFTVSCS